MRFAHTAKLRSNCMKRSVGAIVVKDKRIVSVGYNGTPHGYPNCYELGCERCNSNTPAGVDLENCLCIHAEENAILEAGNLTSHLANYKFLPSAGRKAARGADVYCTHFPCIWCSKIMAQAVNSLL